MFERYGYNRFLIERYVSLFGQEFTIHLLDSNDKPLPKSIRINTLRSQPSETIKQLESKGFVFSRINWCEYGYTLLKEPFPPGATPEYLLGKYYIQDASSMAPSIELSPAKGETILDMAAAPGGKTTHLAQLMDNTGIIVAVDDDKKRMQALKNNVERMGVENVIALKMRAQNLGELGLKFDKILLDAPCTSDGTIRKNPERRRTLNREALEVHSIAQRELIETAVNLLKPKGVLVYSTCSLSPEEDELQINHAVEKFGVSIMNLRNKFCSPGLTKIFGKKYREDLSKCGRFYPHIHDTQGFFMAKLMKT